MRRPAALKREVPVKWSMVCEREWSEKRFLGKFTFEPTHN